MQIEIMTRNTLTDAFRRVVRRLPGKIALRFTDRSWSFKQLDQASDKVAHQLYAMGLKPGDRLAVYGKNSDIYLITFFACIRAGIIHVPINYALIEEELSYIIKQSGASALFYDPALQANVQALGQCGDLHTIGTLQGGNKHDLLKIALHPEEVSFAPHPADELDCVQIMYTSGTTSSPKGAIMTHRCLMAEYMSCIAHLDARTSDRWLAALPLYHTAQMHAATVPALLNGAYTVLIESPDPEISLGLIEQENITVFFAPPTVWIGFLRHKAFDQFNLSSLRNLYYGASIMPEPIIQELTQRLPDAKLYNVYGQTELSPVATVLLPEEHNSRPTSAGKPVMNVETRVVDPNMQDVKPGEQGEIVHRSPHLMAGYWNKPEETKEAFAGGWFHSGDLGVMDEQGYLYIVDRVKDVINTGGVLVASRQVEDALYKNSAVKEVAVIGLPDQKWIEAITAIIVLKDDVSTTQEELILHCREHLAAFKVPKIIHFVDILPKNASGKILKRELRNNYRNNYRNDNNDSNTD